MTIGAESNAMHVTAVTLMRVEGEQVCILVFKKIKDK